MKKLAFAALAGVAAFAAAPAQAAITYSFSGFSDVVSAAQTVTFSVDNYLSGNVVVPASAFTECTAGDGDCVDISFAEVDPFNGLTDSSLFNFETTTSGTFYYFLKDAFKANGTYNSSVSFNFATLTVSGIPGGAVPEPASWAMMIGGLALAGGLMRRSRAVQGKVRFA